MTRSSKSTDFRETYYPLVNVYILYLWKVIMFDGKTCEISIWPSSLANYVQFPAGWKIPISIESHMKPGRSSARQTRLARLVRSQDGSLWDSETWGVWMTAFLKEVVAFGKHTKNCGKAPWPCLIARWTSVMAMFNSELLSYQLVNAFFLLYYDVWQRMVFLFGRGVRCLKLFCVFLDFTGYNDRAYNQSPSCLIKPTTQMANKAQDTRWSVFGMRVAMCCCFLLRSLKWQEIIFHLIGVNMNLI